MDVLRFEWDLEKDVANRGKHGVSFIEAQSVFQDDLARLIADPVHSRGEERFVLMGMSHNQRLLVVCHCEHERNLIRIFSARTADRKERKQYEDFNDA